MGDGLWLCGRCTLENVDEDPECKACGCRKPCDADQHANPRPRAERNPCDVDRHAASPAKCYVCGRLTSSPYRFVGCPLQCCTSSYCIIRLHPLWFDIKQ